MKNKTIQRQLKSRQQKVNSSIDLKFIEHLKELRKRLTYIAISVIIFSTLAYFIQQQLISLLLKPAKGLQFIYTSPGGGINFLFEVCLYLGIALSFPVIVYQILKFIEPVIKRDARELIYRSSLISGILAVIGIIFGYVMGLPIALTFLTHQFTSPQIKPLFTIQEYMSFVTFYLVASSLLFQLPLVLSTINKIKPLRPKALIRIERYVIVSAFIVSGLMAPTINLMSQLVIALPIIISYQIGIVLIWITNKRTAKSYTPNVHLLLEKDSQIYSQRQDRASQLKPISVQNLATATDEATEE